MSTVDTPSGFKPFGEFSRPLVPFQPIASNYATALAVGDAVTLSSGNVQQSSATDTIDGIIIALYDSNGLACSQGYSPASTAGYATLCTDHNQLWVIQSDGVGSDLAATDVGKTYKTTVGTIDSTTGISAFELDASETNATAYQLELIGKVDSPSSPQNTWGGTVDCIVRIKLHSEA